MGTIILTHIHTFKLYRIPLKTSISPIPQTINVGKARLPGTVMDKSLPDVVNHSTVGTSAFSLPTTESKTGVILDMGSDVQYADVHME